MRVRPRFVRPSRGGGASGFADPAGEYIVSCILVGVPLVPSAFALSPLSGASPLKCGSRASRSGFVWGLCGFSDFGFHCRRKLMRLSLLPLRVALAALRFLAYPTPCANAAKCHAHGVSLRARLAPIFARARQ